MSAVRIRYRLPDMIGWVEASFADPVEFQEWFDKMVDESATVQFLQLPPFEERSKASPATQRALGLAMLGRKWLGWAWLGKRNRK